MKVQSFLAFVCVSLLFGVLSACSSSDEVEVVELPFQEKEKLFLKDFREKVRGEWNIDKIVIAKSYISGDADNDSTITNLGSIFINNIYNDPICAEKYNQMEAYFYMNDEVIPFKSELLCLPKLYNADIDEVTGLIESAYYISFPMNTNEFSEEYQFLDRYFFRDNYIMVLSEDEKSWSWKGLNRFIREIVFTKK